MTGIAQVVFQKQSNGSLIYSSGGRVMGSALIGLSFDTPEYFWGRLSATTDAPYNAATSGGTNYSALNQSLINQAKARIDALRTADPNNIQSIPVDLVTASASGLDPQISPAAAYYQAARVARVRGMSEAKVRDLIAQYTILPTWGIFGEPRVNVLMLNLALDSVQ
jgi:K+-transporting ATPase ATPase C chain